MISPSSEDFGSIHKYKWRPSLAFKVRTRLAGAFAPVECADASLSIKGRLEPATPKIDFEFPPIEYSAINLGLPPIKISDDLRSEHFGTEVSEDLFVPLIPSRSDGKVYGQRPASLDEEQPSFTFATAPSRDKDGYRKSFTEYRDRSGTTRKTVSFWELLLPLLQPPLSFDFAEFFGLPNELYDYQPEGIRFLADRESALLGDDMGIGKTIQTIVALGILFQIGAIKSALLVVPLSVLRNWDIELEKWAPLLKPTVVRGQREQRIVGWEKPAHVWLATYGTVRSDIEEIIKYRSFDVVVLDEIHAIKNPGAGQSKAAKRIPRQRSWGLSGTPIENRLEDLFSIFDFLKPGLLPQDGLSGKLAREKIRPYFLRRRKEDVLDDLPMKKAFDRWLVMEGDQRAGYDKAEQLGIVYLKELGEQVTVTHILELLQRLKMICNRDPESGISCKLDFLKERVEVAVSEGSKVLIFSQFVGEGVDFLEREFSDYNPAVVTGQVTGRKRHEVISAFQNNDDCKLYIATPKTGGVGVNLVAGNYVFHFDHWWNPATVRQAEDRVHRIGQTKDVFVYHLWTENTVEERIYRILERKQQLYDDVIDELSNVKGTGLSKEELFDLFDLQSPKKKRAAERHARTGVNILDKLLALSPGDFETVVSLIYEAQGFRVKVTQGSRDAGVDVIASRGTPGGGVEKYAIQCKRYDPSNKVGRPDAQKLLGVLGADKSYTKGVLATTSNFSPDCLDFALGRGNLELIDGNSLVRLIEHFQVSLD